MATSELRALSAPVARARWYSGFGVPLFGYKGQRTLLPEKAARRGPDGNAAYWAEKNVRSIDGLPTGLLE